jgi:hypothetical protein
MQTAMQDVLSQSTDGFSRITVMIVIGGAVYVLPTMLAWARRSRRRWRITFINLLLGWTLIGWIVAMVLTFAYEAPPDGAPPDEPHLR